MAIAKIQAEMDANKSNTYIQVVGKFLLEHLTANPGAAGQILAEGNSIKGSLEYMKNEASKKKVNNCAVLTPDEGYAIVLKYFGIDAAPAAPQPAKQASSDFDISLDDLLAPRL